ncbi:pilus assembly protein PilP [Ramlibacter sp. H39-3-26]|nr:pilus assembly protein PilP [Ramlibacter sp. H39-3-26]MDF1483763.1 pilus assembly protein PilP [Ramlibacter sp. H39-3-26]
MRKIGGLSILLCFGIFSLAGCGSSDDDLRQWMAELRSQTKPRVTPITEPKKFSPEDYTQESALEPFNRQRLTQALRRDSNQAVANTSLISPELTRRKQPLEAFPLDAMAMVGSLDKNGTPIALLRVDNLLYQVHVGDYLGQNYGRVLKITETAIVMREIVQDSTGDWIERPTTLELQEGKK